MFTPITAFLVALQMPVAATPPQTNAIEPQSGTPLQLAALELGSYTIVGSPQDAAQVTGAATVLDQDILETFEYADIQNILRQVPGVSLQVEDGYGLRPNISIRGVATERSSRITLMEDNVLIAPAPYAAPSAYYFPTPGRINAVEVLKGPATITEGPYTIGGALNLVSTPIPAVASGQLLIEGGSHGEGRSHLWYGDQTERFGFLGELHLWQADGYQDIDFSTRDTGLEKEDGLIKLRGIAGPDYRHQFDLKLQYSEEDSNQSYLGLSDADFNADPFRRYSVSQLDNIQTRHEQVMLTHTFELSDSTHLVTTAYNNDFARNWFKTEGIDLDGSDSAASFDRTGWFDVIQAVNRGEAIGDFSAAELQAILDGQASTADGSIELRNNDREYYARGIQTRVYHEFDAFGAAHDLDLGLRYHEDEEDRLQRFSTYHLEPGGVLVLDDPGQLGNAGNRIQEAQAWAFHIRDAMTFGPLTVSPGLRIEDIEQQRTRFEIRPDRTDNPAERSAANLRSTRENDTTVYLPGIGLRYQLNDGLALIGGAHKGFSAPTNAPGVREEEAWNYEAGLRWFGGSASAEAIAFYSDYENLLGVCTASSGVGCEIGAAFNGDAARVSGLELAARADLLALGESVASDWRLPVSLNYTYIDGEFQSDIADTEFFGDVSAGDSLPYIPDHQLFAQIGLERGPWGVYLNANYVDDTCVRASCGPFEQTEDATLVDLSAHYDLTSEVTLYGRVENLTDEEAILGRQPYGARPNKDRSVIGGIRWTF